MQKAPTYLSWDEEYVQTLQNEIGDYLELIKWAYRAYPNEIVYACSFGAEGIVLTDLIHNIKREAKIIFLDTGLHFKETYAAIDKVKDKYPTLDIQLLKPQLSLEEQALQYGDQLWQGDPNLCCRLRKIIPLEEALKGVKAWISGLRREASPTRKHLQFINKDERFKVIKICPLIEWTWEDIWRYIKQHDLPYNTLHDQHYPSIGCEPCTLPSSDTQNLRAGRWAHTAKTECGLHQSSS